MSVAKKSQLLIVDDYPTNIKVLSDLLIEYGFEVLIARDGENALQKLQRISPDLILLDVLMPGIDGFETCRRLKNQPSTADIPVIFMTALADPIDKIKGLTLGAVDYITKPFQQEEVLARVNAHLKLRYLTRQLEEQNSQLQEEARSRRIAESALRVSEEKFAKAFRSNPGPMMILTLEEGRILEVNQNFCKILGFAPEVVRGRSLHELELCSNSGDTSSLLASMKAHRAIQNREYSVHTQDGNLRHLLVSAEVIDVRDQPCILAMMLDVTDCKQASIELQQAKTAADLANQAKSLFLANISHELRSPLNAILGYAQLMSRDETLNLEQQEHLGIISRSSDHLLTLINDVLEMTKIEAGQLTLNETAFNLNALLASLYAMMEPKLQGKDLQFSIERDPATPPYVRADATKLRQVLINIVGNGIKFSQRGHVTLRVGPGSAAVAADRLEFAEPERLTPTAEPTLQFAIADTGPGIAPDEIGSLFDPFIQTEAGRRSQEGTGLGLPISQRFVQLMGGTIRVDSTVGAGSTFSFEIPVGLATVETATADSPRVQQRVERLALDQPRYRLLVVEDQPANQLLLVKLLTAVGFEVRAAGNGEGAIAQCQTWWPHLVWMDVRMPVMDGYEATRRIKALPRPQGQVSPKIIALTANAFEEERLTALQAGCDDFVRKPIQEQVLFDKIAQHLGVRYRYRDAMAVPPASAGSAPELDPTVRQELWDLADGDRAFLKDYLTSHLEAFDELMPAIQQAVADSDAEALTRSAHTLKGMSLTFGATHIRDLCLAIELSAKAGITDISSGQLQQLKANLESLSAAVRSEQARLN